MGALANPLPQSPRKPAARASRLAKLNQYGRDPQLPSERKRCQSNYDKETGYAPFYHAFWADLCRLSSGASCMALIGLLWSESAGRGMKKGEPRPEWTPSLRVEDLAQICCCDTRTVERELTALDRRGLAEIRRPGKGEVEARLKYRDWESLPNYKSAVVEMPVSDDTEDSAEADESAPGNQRVTGRKPVRLPAGHVSKAFPVSSGVKSFRHRVEGPVDLEFSCVIQAGELLVVSRVPDETLQKWQNSQPRSNEINDKVPFPRHGCRGESEVVPTNEGSKKLKPQGEILVSHPREAELHRIFDPVLAHSGASLLSMPSSRKFSLEACAKVADCDHEYLARFVANKGKIKAVTWVPGICADALESWKASKVLDGAGLSGGIETPRLSAQGKRVAEGLRRIHGK